jgi:hypothetical protein
MKWRRKRGGKERKGSEAMKKEKDRLEGVGVYIFAVVDKNVTVDESGHHGADQCVESESFERATTRETEASNFRITPKECSVIFRREIKTGSSYNKDYTESMTDCRV